MFTLDLPFPPSLNNLFHNRTGGRHPSTKYKDWQTEAGWEIARRHPVPIPGKVKIAYVLQDKGRCDLDNLAKATTDLLVTHKLIDGDGRKFVREINFAWSADVKGVRITVTRFINCGASSTTSAPHLHCPPVVPDNAGPSL